MKHILFLVMMAVASVLFAAAEQLPADITWIYEFDAAAGNVPDPAVWSSTYNSANISFADGVMKLDNSTMDAYQAFNVVKADELLSSPKGDMVVNYRVRCLEAPKPSKADEFPGFFTCGVFGQLGEENFGFSILLSRNEMLYNFGSRVKLPKELEINLPHDVCVLFKRRQGSVHIWVDSEYIGRFPAAMQMKNGICWGDCSGGVCGKVGVEFIRFGLTDISDDPVYLPGCGPYTVPKQVSGIIQNEDCTQFFYSPSFPATKEGLEAYLTECYLPEHCQITEFMLNPQSQRASYDSKVIPTSWRDFVRNEDGKLTYNGKVLTDAQQSAFGRMMTLAENGVDPYKVWIDLLRSRSISPWISIRMNDVHDASNEQSHMHCDLWRQHPEYRIAPYRKGDWFAQQLDYARPEVREYMLRLVDELLERYDSDGLELDWMRFCRVFKYGHELENRHLLTEFIQEIRNRCDAAAGRYGHPVKIAVRVQMDPVDALNGGFDVQEWCRRKLVDIVVPAPFFDNNWEKCPMEIWRAIVGPDVLLAPCLDTSYKGERTSARICTSEYDNALATYYLAHGADRIYLFNHFGKEWMNMRTLGSLEKASASTRRHVTLYKDDVAMGEQPTYLLPKTLASGSGWWGIRMSLGRKPETGRRAYVFACSRAPFPAEKNLAVRLNGELIRPCANPRCANFEEPLKGVAAFEIPDGALFDDGNVIEFANDTGVPITLNRVEIYIEALE